MYFLEYVYFKIRILLDKKMLRNTNNFQSIYHVLYCICDFGGRNFQGPNLLRPNLLQKYHQGPNLPHKIHQGPNLPGLSLPTTKNIEIPIIQLKIYIRYMKETCVAYDVVSDLMHNAVAMCQQNSYASQDAPKDLFES